MALVPWRSKSPVSTLQQEMNRFFEDFLPSGFGPSADNAVWPAVNVKEDEKAITVEAEIPGVKKDNIKANVVGDMLTISGEKKEEKKEEKENFVRVERSHGSFHRRIRLPCEVDAEHTEAQMSDGLLKLRMPKVKSTPRKEIKIK